MILCGFRFCILLLFFFVSMFCIAILIKNWGKAGVKKESSAKWRRRMFCLQLTFKARMSKILKTHHFFTKELVFYIHKLQIVVCSNEMSVALHRWSIFQEWRWWGTNIESVKKLKDWQKSKVLHSRDNIIIFQVLGKGKHGVLLWKEYKHWFESFWRMQGRGLVI